MKSVKDLRRKAAKRTAKTAPVYSTSEARANFAEALETTQLDSAVIGFDRYGRTVAALVPVEAIYMLAGLGGKIDAGTRQKIDRAARVFVAQVPNRVGKSIARAAAKKKSASKSAKAKARNRNR
jgi:endonuclease YncB( thermonuclease family)